MQRAVCPCFLKKDYLFFIHKSGSFLCHKLLLKDKIQSLAIGCTFSLGIIKLSTQGRYSPLCFISLGSVPNITLLHYVVTPPPYLPGSYLSCLISLSLVYIPLLLFPFLSSCPILLFVFFLSFFASLPNARQLLAVYPPCPLSNQSPWPHLRVCPVSVPAPPR